MSGGTGRPSSQEVAHEAEDTRAHLASTLEQLRTNLQPGNVVEEVVSNARIGAASVADNLVEVAKRYPIPSALIAAGSAIVMRVFSRGGAPGAGRRAAALPRAAGPSGVDDLPPTSMRSGEAMPNVTRYLPSDRSEVKSKLSNLLDEQPLILGAIGLAIGAAIGAALPATETEDQLMGSTAHRVRGAAADAARQETEEMRTVASQAIDNVRHSAQDNLRTVVDKAGGSLEPGTRDV